MRIFPTNLKQVFSVVVMTEKIFPTHVLEAVIYMCLYSMSLFHAP